MGGGHLIRCLTATSPIRRFGDADSRRHRLVASWTSTHGSSSNPSAPAKHDTKPMVEEQVLELIKRTSASEEGKLPFTPRANGVLRGSVEVALQLGHNYIGTEHLLLGLFGDDRGQRSPGPGTQLRRRERPDPRPSGWLRQGLIAAQHAHSTKPTSNEPTTSGVDEEHVPCGDVPIDEAAHQYADGDTRVSDCSGSLGNSKFRGSLTMRGRAIPLAWVLKRSTPRHP